MSERRTASGVWVVIGLLALGVIAGVAGLIVRKLPERGDGGTTPAPTTQSHQAERQEG